ncbi:hypothetical protein [Peptoniphilus lacrimalis]|uniref:Bacterial PH domain-containing protein n=1 Tax=Peptoniphilus lacrimalis TaxID=33031 RepID=A0A379C7F3_9FIRM|nr:hypothetical protein [Peptoniphilus lacrimalis]SUB57517.1 Uncharacterised protein [Peptoniphilus lacrimalis]
MKFDLPWKDLDGNIYSYIDVKNRKNYVNYIAWFLTILFALIGFFTVYRIGLFIALVLFLTLVYKRYVVVTSRGLEIFYNIFISKSYEIWDWEDIYALTYANDYDYKDLKIIYFTKGDITKRFYFKSEDLQGIISLAKSKSKKIKIFDAAKNKSFVKN